MISTQQMICQEHTLETEDESQSLQIQEVPTQLQKEKQKAAEEAPKLLDEMEEIELHADTMMNELAKYIRFYKKMVDQPYPHYTVNSSPSEVKKGIHQLFKVQRYSQMQAIKAQLLSLEVLLRSTNKTMEILGTNDEPGTLSCLTKNGKPQTYTDEQRKQICHYQKKQKK